MPSWHEISQHRNHSLHVLISMQSPQAPSSMLWFLMFIPIVSTAESSIILLSPKSKSLGSLYPKLMMINSSTGAYTVRGRVPSRKGLVVVYLNIKKKKDHLQHGSCSQALEIRYLSFVPRDIVPSNCSFSILQQMCIWWNSMTRLL